MTTTTLSSSQSLTAGYGIAPSTAASVTLNAGTTAYCITLKLTNGACSGDPGKPLRVYIASTAIATSVPTTELRKESAVLDVQPHMTPGASTIQASPLLARKGDVVHVWYEVPNWAATCTLTAVCYEIN